METDEMELDTLGDRKTALALILLPTVFSKQYSKETAPGFIV